MMFTAITATLLQPAPHIALHNKYRIIYGSQIHTNTHIMLYNGTYPNSPSSILYTFTVIERKNHEVVVPYTHARDSIN